MAPRVFLPSLRAILSPSRSPVVSFRHRCCCARGGLRLRQESAVLPTRCEGGSQAALARDRLRSGSLSTGEGYRLPCPQQATRQQQCIRQDFQIAAAAVGTMLSDTGTTSADRFACGNRHMHALPSVASGAAAGAATWQSSACCPMREGLKGRRRLTVSAVETAKEDVALRADDSETDPTVISSGGTAASVKGEGEEETLKIVLPTNESSERLLRIRHTSAHVMAMAVQKLFPDAQVTIGPWIEKGFYYDFDLKEPLTEKDLKKIQKEMIRIINRNLSLRREEVAREEAKRRIQEINEPYKLEILEGIKSEPITIYHIGDEWWDLCAGPHVERTGELRKDAFELEAVAGAYWRGDENRQMLQRVYGTAWESGEQLKEYKRLKEEALRRDHRRIGKDLNLFSIQEEAGSGLVFWHPKGAIMRHLIEDYWKNVHLREGYELIYSPHVAKLDLWKTSGHFDFYRENMFDQMQIENESYQLRPMNCPFHITVYKEGMHSYRDLPFRWAELGTVYRYEKSGTMHGLFRVRGFTQDDGHIFCLPEQMTDEILGVLNLTEGILTTFGFKKYEINLSTRPEKSVGDDEIWEKATSALREALDLKGWKYEVDEGGGAFYGPKIDLKIEDAIGRKWQCSTIQVDFNLPERFNLFYIDKDNSRARPIMIHRAIFGSLERFFGILIENYAGDFPLWIAPVQVRVLPVTDHQVEHCMDVVRLLKDRGIRAELSSGERLPKLIRNAEKARTPVMVVVGPKEVETSTLAVRTRNSGDLGSLGVEELTAKLRVVISDKTTI